MAGDAFASRYETLPAGTDFLTAKAEVKRKELELLTGEKLRFGAPAVPDGLSLKAALEEYAHVCATKSPRTDRAYRYTMQQFYESSGDKPLVSKRNTTCICS